MYGESGVMFTYLQNLSPDAQQIDDFFHSHKYLTSTVSDYDLGGEGDLFKASESIIEPPFGSLAPVPLNATDIQSLQSEEFLSNVFFDCNETSPLSEVLNFQFPATADDKAIVKETGQIPKSMSCDSLIHGAQIRPNFLSFSDMEIGNAYGMRRAFSEGDIKTLSNGNTSLGHSPLGQQQHANDHITEDRLQKLSRYRNKKTKRNFGRKIKYACRKALADSQPRIRGRFAKTEETDILKK